MFNYASMNGCVPCTDSMDVADHGNGAQPEGARFQPTPENISAVGGALSSIIGAFTGKSGGYYGNDGRYYPPGHQPRTTPLWVYGAIFVGLVLAVVVVSKLVRKD